MERDPLESVYRVDGMYADPYDVLSILKSTPDHQKQEVIDSIKRGRLDRNKNIKKAIKKFEYERDLSS